METRARRQLGLLGALGACLFVILWWNLSRVGPAPAAGQTAKAPKPASKPARARDEVEHPVDVALEALAAPRPEPADGTRNPFRFAPKAAPPPSAPPGFAGGVPGLGNGPGGGPSVPAGPPPTPAIPLKFIGIVEEPSQGLRIAALSDGRFTYYGREGDIIEGRYRIVRIGLESIEMAHVDGRGQQTIRLSGS